MFNLIFKIGTTSLFFKPFFFPEDKIDELSDSIVEAEVKLND